DSGNRGSGARHAPPRHRRRQAQGTYRQPPRRQLFRLGHRNLPLAPDGQDHRDRGRRAARKSDHAIYLFPQWEHRRRRHRAFGSPTVYVLDPSRTARGTRRGDPTMKNGKRKTESGKRKSKIQNPKSKIENGFTLLEVVVAMAIVGLGVVALLEIFSY